MASGLENSKKDAGNNDSSPVERILVIEDDSFLRKLIVDKLKRENFQVSEASVANEVFAELKKNIPALIILDLLMPGMSGFQILEEIRKNPDTKNLPVMVLSNLGDPNDKEKAEKLGIDDYLIKAHFTLEEIVEHVHSVIKKRYF